MTWKTANLYCLTKLLSIKAQNIEFTSSGTNSTVWNKRMQKIFQTLVHFRYTVKLIEINKIVPKQSLSRLCSACIKD